MRIFISISICTFLYCHLGHAMTDPSDVEFDTKQLRKLYQQVEDKRHCPLSSINTNQKSQ